MLDKKKKRELKKGFCDHFVNIFEEVCLLGIAVQVTLDTKFHYLSYISFQVRTWKEHQIIVSSGNRRRLH